MANTRIVSAACCRVDLAGGTLDIWPLYLFHPGATTVNFAVSIATRCEIAPRRSRAVVLRSLDTGRTDHFPSISALLRAPRYKHALAGHLCREFLTAPDTPRNGFELTTMSESPAGAGISGSSALMVATTAGLAAHCGVPMEKEQIRVVAQNVEARLIGVPTGCQDYYPALYGGVNSIRLHASGTIREEIAVSSAEIESRFVLAYTGAPRQSGINNWQVFQKHINGERKVFRNFERIAAIARAMQAALAAQAWSEVARLLQAEWTLRKTNAPGITTPMIDRLVRAAMTSGAQAAKVCGAGGGGCVVFLIEPRAHRAVVDAIHRNHGTVLPFRVPRTGVHVRRVSE